MLRFIASLSSREELKMSDQFRYLQQEVSRLQDENKTLKEEVISLRQYLDSLTALMQAVDEIDPQAEIMPLLDRIVYNALGVINAEAGSLLVRDEETGDLVFVLAHGEVPRESLAGMRIPAGKGIAGWVSEHRKPALVNNAPSDARFYGAIDDRVEFRTNTILAAPIIGNGNVLGVIEVLNKANDMLFSQTDQMLLTLLCRFAGEVLSAMMMRDANTNSTASQASDSVHAAPTEAPPA